MGDRPVADLSGLEEASLEGCEGIARDAAAASPNVGAFVYQFSDFLLNQHAYKHLGLRDMQLAPLRSLVTDDGFTAFVREMQEQPWRAATYQFCATSEEAQESRANILLEWRLDKQYPTGMELWLPYRDEPFNFLPFAQKPTKRRTLVRLLDDPELNPDVQENGDKILIRKRIATAQGTARFCRQFEYLGCFGDEQQYHMYGNTPQSDTLRRAVSIADMLGFSKPQ